MSSAARGGGSQRGGHGPRGRKPGGPGSSSTSHSPAQGSPSPQPQSASPAPVLPSAAAQSLMKDRMLFLLAGLAGSSVAVTLKNGTVFHGILASAITESEFGVALHRAKRVQPSEDVIKPSLLIHARDVLQVSSLESVDLFSTTAATAAPVQSANLTADTFRTDVQITGSQGDAGGRTLLRWADDIPEEQDQGQGDLMRSTAPNKGWDQFAANEKLFGAKSNYNEEMYTTKLDRNTKDFKQREQQAERLANEILSGTSTNAHVAEERGQQVAPAHASLDEEDKYSGVIRGNNAYVPPSARKGGASPAGNASANGKEQASSKNQAKVAPQQQQQKQQQPSAAAAPTPVMAVNGTPAGIPGASNENTKQHQKDTASAGATQPAEPHKVIGAFNSFVDDEKKRLEPKKAAAAMKAREDKLAELRSFSQSFKLKNPMPKDLASLLDKKEQEKADVAAGRTGPASTSVTPQMREAQIAPRLGSPAATATPQPAASTGQNQNKGKAGFELPDIPSFAQLKQQREAKAAGAAKAEAWIKGNSTPGGSAAAAPSTSSRISATAKEFKPNPNATAFTPGGPSPSPARKAAELPGARQQAASPSVQIHPFFGAKTPKKSSSVLHVKEDFSPFKHGDVPDPASISYNWNFAGPSYRSMAAGPQQPTLGTPLVQVDDRSNTKTPSSAASGGNTPLPGPPPPLQPVSMPFTPGQPQPMSVPGPGGAPMQPQMLQPTGMPYQTLYYPQMPQQYRYPNGSGQPPMPGLNVSGPPGAPQSMPYPSPQYMGFPPGSVPPAPPVYSPQMNPNSPHQPFPPNPNMFSPRQGAPPPMSQSFYYNAQASPQPIHPGPPPHAGGGRKGPGMMSPRANQAFVPPPPPSQ